MSRVRILPTRSDSTCPDRYSLEGAVSVSFLGDVNETCPHSYSPKRAVYVSCLGGDSLEGAVPTLPCQLPTPIQVEKKRCQGKG